MFVYIGSGASVMVSQAAHGTPRAADAEVPLPGPCKQRAAVTMAGLQTISKKSEYHITNVQPLRHLKSLYNLHPTMGSGRLHWKKVGGSAFGKKRPSSLGRCSCYL